MVVWIRVVMMAKEAVEFRGFGAVFGGRMYKTCKWISYVEAYSINSFNKEFL